jgi:hypothetical protein
MSSGGAVCHIEQSRDAKHGNTPFEEGHLDHRRSFSTALEMTGHFEMA